MGIDIASEEAGAAEEAGVAKEAGAVGNAEASGDAEEAGQDRGRWGGRLTLDRATNKKR